MREVSVAAHRKSKIIRSAAPPRPHYFDGRILVKSGVHFQKTKPKERSATILKNTITAKL